LLVLEIVGIEDEWFLEGFIKTIEDEEN